MWETVRKYLGYSQAIALLGCIAFILYLKYAPRLSPVTSTPGEMTTAHLPASVERIIEKIRVVEKPGPERIIYLDKPRLAVALKMPSLETIPDNVLSVATVEPHTGPTTAIAVLSPKGEGKILLRKEPPKFFQIKREWGARAGLGTGNLILGEVYARPLRLGIVEVELRGFARSDRDRGADFGALVLVDVKFQ